MQSIIHTTSSYSYHFSLLREIEHIYTITSEKWHKTPNMTLLSPVLNTCMQPLMEMFSQNGYHYDITYLDKRIDKVDISKLDPNVMIVCFSGGKDSLAAALHYKARGYKVYLYHVTGLNKHYTTEHKSAKALADELGLPLILEDISYKGQHEWVEHPLKNIVLAGMALNYGLTHGLGYKIAVGNFYTLRSWDCVFEVDIGDSVDMWKIYERIIKNAIPRFHMYVPLQNYQTSYKTILKYKPNLLLDVQSCITPNRFRGLFKKRTELKYGIALLPDRCGCCWKCAVEYIWLCDHGYRPLYKKYYSHCLEILRNTLKKEAGVVYNNIEEVWAHYFFYKMPKWMEEK